MKYEHILRVYFGSSVAYLLTNSAILSLRIIIAVTLFIVMEQWNVDMTWKYISVYIFFSRKRNQFQ